MDYYAKILLRMTYRSMASLNKYAPTFYVHVHTKSHISNIEILQVAKFQLHLTDTYTQADVYTPSYSYTYVSILLSKSTLCNIKYL